MQIAFADRILLNKCDLVTPEDAEALTTRIRGINTLAPIQQCERCAVELSFSYTPGEGAPWALIDLLVRADNALTTRLLLPSVAAGSAVAQLVKARCVGGAAALCHRTLTL